MRVEVAALEESRTIGSASTIMKTAAGISMRLIWRMPMPTARRIPAASRAGGHAAERREQHGGHRDAEQSLGQHVDAEGVVDRARRFLVDERAEGRVDELVEVDDPQADRHRQHQHEHLADARVVPVERELQAEVDARERAEAISSNCTSVATSEAMA